MSFPLTVPPSKKHQSFLWSPICTDLDNLNAHIAILGVPFGQAYSAEHITNDQSHAPDAIRAMSDRICRQLNHYDFDIGGPLLDNRDINVIDVGNVPADPTDLSSHSVRTEATVRKILAAGAIPIIFGGDHGIPIPVLRAYDTQDPITLIHIDAHLDWRDDVNGIREGLSSPIRRASEMSHIGEIFQLGLRAQGSARTEDYEAALAYGVHLYTAYDIHENGIESVLAAIPDNGRYYLTIDADGLDPTIMPGVAGPALGGLTYIQMRKLIHGLVKKGRVVGMDIVEICPSLDVNNISCITAGRLVVNFIGAAVRAEYFDTPIV